MIAANTNGAIGNGQWAIGQKDRATHASPSPSDPLPIADCPLPQPPPNPLADFSDAELADLTNALLEDWSDSAMTELALCRAHRLTLDQLEALAAAPAFQQALATPARLRAARAEPIAQALSDLARESLARVAAIHPTNGAMLRESRLAAQALLVGPASSRPSASPLPRTRQSPEVRVFSALLPTTQHPTHTPIGAIEPFEIGLPSHESPRRTGRMGLSTVGIFHKYLKNSI